MTEELKEQIHERVYNIKVPTLGFSRRDLFNIAMEYAEPREKRIAELEAENQKWKDEWQEQVQKATDEGYARTLQTIQLTKATEIIKKLYAVYYDPCVTESDLKYRDELFAEIKQFLGEVKK